MRQSGILLPMFSLPAPNLGTGAEAFVSYLASAGQSIWQILPLNPPDMVGSPYNSASAFAGDTAYIDPVLLREEGLISDCTTSNPLWEAWRILRASPTAAYQRFLRENRYWIEEYALFAALHDRYRAPWWAWPEALRRRHTDALRQAREALAEEMDYIRVGQFLFDAQLTRLRGMLRRQGITLVGDIPHYVAHDSADAWAAPHLFSLMPDGRVALAAGVPPDHFSASGQLWGNPTYRWDAMGADGYAFWIARLRRCARMYDVVRLDHFRAFDSYYAIPGHHTDARHGTWRAGPGYAFLDTVRREIPELRLIAEDLGELTPSVHAMREKLAIPGMRILQFAFGGRADDPFLPHNYPADTVVYPGTHDNDTAAGWWQTLTPRARCHAAAYLGIKPHTSAKTAVRALMRMASASAADWVIFPLADVSAEGRGSRINTPGSTVGCWQYRARPGFASPEDTAYLAEITTLYGRTR